MRWHSKVARRVYSWRVANAALEPVQGRQLRSIASLFVCQVTLLVSQEAFRRVFVNSIQLSSFRSEGTPFDGRLCVRPFPIVDERLNICLTSCLKQHPCVPSHDMDKFTQNGPKVDRRLR